MLLQGRLLRWVLVMMLGRQLPECRSLSKYSYVYFVIIFQTIYGFLML